MKRRLEWPEKGGGKKREKEGKCRQLLLIPRRRSWVAFLWREGTRARTSNCAHFTTAWHTHTHTHTHFGVKAASAPLHKTARCMCGCVFVQSRSENALKNANASHISITCACVRTCVFFGFLAFQSLLFTALNKSLSCQISNGHTHTHTRSLSNTPAWCY